jgi:hypothetical protein
LPVVPTTSPIACAALTTRHAIGYGAPVLLSLPHVGQLDGRDDLWTVAERAPSGSTWRPRWLVVGPADRGRHRARPSVSAPRPVGSSSGVAHRFVAGQHLSRDDLAARCHGRHLVTGLSQGGDALFARSRENAVSHPLLLHRSPPAVVGSVRHRARTARDANQIRRHEMSTPRIVALKDGRFRVSGELGFRSR